ncbi:hypothetical protein [Swaminathania salitolerans]|uniref:Uncharacterized protein n=1 Tax=Swaminathania salitolerans TaxID=182838 RepID=A0A511BQV0_9PROT|nr:hypothetical protein [Swaminathania salitolerans]GBQ12060.1 hypothetical protein AA21291_1058 [Swaminathania salitolerans LMG 21291]GEL02717.1 hypothetical protein SSA02_18800 [Swaminathania salitolerans]
MKSGSRLAAITFYGSLTTTAALLLLAKRRTGHAAPGVNCTAHWLDGDDAARIGHFDLRHSGVGIATNCAAILFWGVFYQIAAGKPDTGERSRAVSADAWRRHRRFLLATLALGPVAALIDYRATPRRFTPGWELVFSRREMTIVYAAMVAGMALGALRRR